MSFYLDTVNLQQISVATFFYSWTKKCKQKVIIRSNINFWGSLYRLDVRKKKQRLFPRKYTYSQRDIASCQSSDSQISWGQQIDRGVESLFQSEDPQVSLKTYLKIIEFSEMQGQSENAQCITKKSGSSVINYVSAYLDMCLSVLIT